MKNAFPTLIAALAAASAVACSAIPMSKADITDPGELLFNGYTHTNIDCYTCHSGNASGTWKGPNLIGVGQRKSRAEIEQTIRSGPGIMPSYKDDLTEGELGELADWLMSLK